jgi:hypothetical protein
MVVGGFSINKEVRKEVKYYYEKIAIQNLKDRDLEDIFTPRCFEIASVNRQKG